jgi:bifunctional non-homologous end joining protein LigD
LTAKSWRWLFAGKEDWRRVGLAERKAGLKELLSQVRLSDQALIRYVEHFETAGDAILKSACRLSLEGIVSKQLSAPYRSGRGDSWTKAKCRAGHELVIGGWEETSGRFRSLLVGAHKGEGLIYVGKVGTGFGDRVTQKLLARLKTQVTDESPFAGINAPKKGKEFHWVKPVLVAEIEFAGWTSDGLVRQASFKALREDKPAQEVKADKVAKARSAKLVSPRAPIARGPKSGTRGAAQGSAVLGVVISHPEKPLWPPVGAGSAVTKLDLARYYEAVGPWMMEHLKGRPCSIIRAPDGIDGEQFFQRHAMAGSSSLVELVKVVGDHKPYLQVNRMEALAALAQIAAVELHPWNCEPEQPELPGRFIFDLDPAPDLKFDVVIAAAVELKGRLESLGLTPFCKTTGGKGLHVVTPFSISKERRSVGRRRKPLRMVFVPKWPRTILKSTLSICPKRRGWGRYSWITCATTEWRLRLRRCPLAPGLARPYRCRLIGRK